MRLLYFAGSQIPSRSANSVHVMRMCEALSRLGHDVTLLAKMGDSTVVDPYRYYGVSRGFELRLVKFVRRAHLLKYLREARSLGVFDGLVGRYLYPLWLCRGQGQQFLYESHDAPAPVRRVAERLLLADVRCAAHIVISHALAKHYRFLFGSQIAAKTVVLPDASVDPGAPRSISVNAPLVAGYAGALYSGRGIDLLVKMAYRLPRIQFRLAGGSAVEVATRCGPLPSNLECVGHLPHASVPDFLSSCDVLLAPYQAKVAVAGDRGDTSAWCSPLKLFEYQAQGKAIVSSNLPAMQEVLVADETAILCEAADSDQWVAALQRLDRDRALAQRLGNSARDAFLKKYTWQQRAKRLVSCFGHR